MELKFYLSSSGRSPVLEFIECLSDKLQGEFYDAVMRLSDGERLEMPLSRNMGMMLRGLHELRLKDRSGIYRVFYYMKVGDAIYFVHAFKKKTQKTPPKEIELVLSRLKSL